MPPQIFINGEFFSAEEAKVSVYDHGLLYGDGVFEGLRSYEGRIFRLEDHIRRLNESAKAIWLEIPMTPAELETSIKQTLARSQLQDAYVRVIVTRGVGNLGLDPRSCREPQVIIIVDTIELYPQALYEKGLELVTVSVTRNHPAALNPRIKSLNYLNNILAKIEGIQAGCIEALMLNHQGEVAECTGDNLFTVRRGVIQTPPAEAGILEGITRDAVIDLAGQAGYPVSCLPLTKHDIYIADECFLTGTAAEVIPVVKVDSRVIGDGTPGEITNDLKDRFHALARSSD